MATLKETCVLTSRTNVAKKCMINPNLSETLRVLCPKSKNKECDQTNLNISDQFETLIPCSAIYFLGIRSRLLQKLATGSSSMGKKDFMVYNFWGYKFYNENIGVQPIKFMIFWSFYNSHTLLSQIFSGDVRTLFTQSNHQGFFQI